MVLYGFKSRLPHETPEILIFQGNLGDFFVQMAVKWLFKIVQYEYFIQYLHKKFTS